MNPKGGQEEPKSNQKRPKVLLERQKKEKKKNKAKAKTKKKKQNRRRSRRRNKIRRSAKSGPRVAKRAAPQAYLGLGQVDLGVLSVYLEKFTFDLAKSTADRVKFILDFS